MLAGAYDGELYKSANTGGTWLNVTPNGVPGQHWYCCSADSDGGVLLAGVYGGRLWAFKGITGPQGYQGNQGNQGNQGPSISGVTLTNGWTIYDSATGLFARAPSAGIIYQIAGT
jgi:hypothetical protein